MLNRNVPWTWKELPCQNDFYVKVRSKEFTSEEYHFNVLFNLKKLNVTVMNTGMSRNLWFQSHGHLWSALECLKCRKNHVKPGRERVEAYHHTSEYSIDK